MRSTFACAHMIASVLIAFTFFFPFGIAETGDGTHGALVGTVYTWRWGDSQKRVLPHVRVFATSDADVQEARSDDQGRFEFLTLLPGVYEIEAEAPAAFSSWCGIKRKRDTQEISAGVEYRAEVLLISTCR